MRRYAIFKKYPLLYVSPSFYCHSELVNKMHKADPPPPCHLSESAMETLGSLIKKHKTDVKINMKVLTTLKNSELWQWV